MKFTITLEELDAVLIHLEQVEASDRALRSLLRTWQSMMANPDYDLGEMTAEFDKMVNNAIGRKP